MKPVESGDWQVVCIAGVGLIGGSFALALRRAGFSGRIIGVSSPASIEIAVHRGVIDQGLPLDKAAAAADVVYLSTSIGKILETLDFVDAYVRPGTLITDSGSTKAAIASRALEKIRRGRFVGGHPLTGKETRGVAEADARLFEGRKYVLTGSDPQLEHWIGRIGARLVALDPEEHDRLVAMTSHLPQLASTALAEVLGTDPGVARVSGPGAVDMTRLAFSPYADLVRYSCDQRGADQRCHRSLHRQARRAARSLEIGRNGTPFRSCGGRRARDPRGLRCAQCEGYAH